MSIVNWNGWFGGGGGDGGTHWPKPGEGGQLCSPVELAGRFQSCSDEFVDGGGRDTASGIGGQASEEVGGERKKKRKTNAETKGDLNSLVEMVKKKAKK